MYVQYGGAAPAPNGMYQQVAGAAYRPQVSGAVSSCGQVPQLYPQMQMPQMPQMAMYGQPVPGAAPYMQPTPYAPQGAQGGVVAAGAPYGTAPTVGAVAESARGQAIQQQQAAVPGGSYGVPAGFPGQAQQPLQAMPVPAAQCPGAAQLPAALTQPTAGQEGEPDDDDPNRLPTFVKVRGLPAEHDPRIARKPKPKKRAPGVCCA
eukprot:TRINITY_DN7267_c0_g1_i1.p1 TRINITY_DN7267_c0_g1~~TRINITY_DN7267_c0_g1_i1.p1  ORF type:complete len:205 (+),score=39.90 TRINITY_DN7267_c0_g1_i1:62-676(+)